MSDDWERDLSDSRRRFINIVWPEINTWFASGDSDADIELVPTEGADDYLSTEFDRTAGVDFWVIKSDTGMTSIASRVQTYDMTTFTVRYERGSGVDTEHQKRVRQYRDRDAHLPTYTIQAYVDATLCVLRNAGIIRTSELYEHILSQRCPISEDELIGSDESEQFYAVPWSNLVTRGLYVHDRDRAGLSERGQQSLMRFCDDGEVPAND